MNVNVEVLSPVSKKIVVEIPAEEATRALEDQLKRIGKTAVVRGFRAGKVPKDLVKKLYGADAEERAVGELLSRHLEAALTQAAVEPLGRPDFDRQPLVAGQPFTFSLFCAVYPEFELHLPTEFTLERRSTQPSEEQVEAELRTLREKRAELETVEDRGADTGDIVSISYTARVVGEETAFTGESAVEEDVTLGKPFLIAEVPDRLAGAKADDSLTIEVTLAEDYPQSDVAGKAAVVEVKVNAVRRKVVPDLDDELAKELGFADADAARASTYDRLSEQARQQEEQRVDGLLTDALLEKNPIEAPQPLVEAHTQQVLNQITQQFNGWGLEESLVKRLIERESESIRKSSLRAVQRDIIIDRVAKEKGISVSEDDLDAEVARLGERLSMPAAKVKGRLQSNGGLDDLRERLQRQATMNVLLEEAYARVAGAEPEVTADEAPAAEAPAAE